MKMPADGWDPEEREALQDLGSEFSQVRRRRHAEPPLDVLRAAREGVLPDDLQQSVEQYRTRDRWARTLTDDLASTEVSFTKDDEDRLFRRIRRGLAEETRVPRWFIPRRLAVATAVIVVTVVGAVWYADRRVSIRPAQPEQVASVPREMPAFVLALEKPPIELSLAALTWRGGGGKGSLADQLKAGLDAFRADDYATADTELGRAAAAFPDTVDPLYYQGVSRLFRNDFAGAVDSLSAAARAADPSFRPHVLWYLAIAEERAGRIEEARAHVRSVCDSKSVRSREACAALPRLK